MNGLMEQILLISSVLGFLLGIALISHIFRKHKANFFLGLIVWLMALELLFFVFALLIFLESMQFPAIQNGDNRDLFSNYDDQLQLKRLNNILEEKQLFIRPGLSLKELSRELNLPPRYLSYLINRYHQKNFNELINEHRIDAFITKARSPDGKHKTLLAIALESGFNSKSSFNQVFKDLKGKSPSEYLNQN